MRVQVSQGIKTREKEYVATGVIKCNFTTQIK